MASRRSSISRVTTPIVHLSCNQCSHQLGIFENEWTRLTSSYARCKQNGRNTGTDIGNKIQYVPEGVTQKLLEGCGMTEIFCKECSNLVGQFCKTVPSADKQHLMGNYLYKLSRTHIVDARTKEKVGFEFTCDESALMPPPPKIKTSAKSTHRSTPRQSVSRSASVRSFPRPSVSYNPRDSLGMLAGIEDYRQPVDRNTGSQMREDSILAERLSHLEQRMAEQDQRDSEHERRITDYESEFFRRDHTMTPLARYRVQSHDHSLERSFSQQESEQDSLVEDQRKQITALTTQVETLNETIKDLRGLIQDLRSERDSAKSTPVTPSLPATGPVNFSSFDDMISAMKNAQAQSAELVQVRLENEQLKARFSVIEGAMGMVPGSVTNLPGDSAVTAIGLLSSGAQLPTPTGSQHARWKDDNKSLIKLDALVSAEPSERGNEVITDDDVIETGGDVDEEVDGEENNGEAEATPSETGSFDLQQIWDAPSISRVVAKAQHNLSTSSPHPASGRADIPGSASKPASPPKTAPRVSSPPLEFEPEPEEVLPTNRPMFGVIKPVSARAAKRTKAKAAQEPQVPVVPSGKHVNFQLVDFSDDENPTSQPEIGTEQPQTACSPLNLHYGRRKTGPPAAPGVSPWVQPKSASTQSDAENGRPETPRSNSGDIEINVMGPEEFRQRQERRENGIKSPREKKPQVQTTEKLLNEELEELGLAHWIGQDKKNNEYRQAIETARAEKRERKKQEILAAAGILNPDAPVLLVPAPAPASKSKAKKAQPERKFKTLHSLRRTHSRSGKADEPLADVTNHQNAQTKGRPGGKRKADAIEEAENNDATATMAVGKAKNARKDVNAGVKTRRQTRHAEIEKLDRLAEQAMEVDDTV